MFSQLKMRHRADNSEIIYLRSNTNFLNNYKELKLETNFGGPLSIFYFYFPFAAFSAPKIMGKR